MCQLQEKVRNFHQQFEVSRTVDIYLLDLTSEVGELAKEYLNITQYGKKLQLPCIHQRSSRQNLVMFCIRSLA